jgi:hypothetical protein
MSGFGETAGPGGGCREFGAEICAELRTTEMRVKNDARWTANKCHACDSSKRAIDDHPESTAITQPRQCPAIEREAGPGTDSVTNPSSMARRHRSLHVDQDIDLQWLAIHLNCLVGCDADDEVFRKILAT